MGGPLDSIVLSHLPEPHREILLTLYQRGELSTEELARLYGPNGIDVTGITKHIRKMMPKGGVSVRVVTGEPKHSRSYFYSLTPEMRRELDLLIWGHTKGVDTQNPEE